MSSYAEGSTDVPQPGPSTSNDPPRTAKVVLIGSASVGKTSLRNRYFRGPKGFTQAYIATIGADFTTKTIDLDDDNNAGGAGSRTRMSLQLWDTAGQERFQALGAAFYRGADACIIVYACNSPTSAERIESWFNAFVERCPLKDGQERDFPFICVGNKHDLVRSTQDKDLVHEKDVLGILKRICPPVEPNKSVSIDHKPSGMPITSDVNGAVQQQEQELGGTQTIGSTSRTRRGSSISTKRRSLEILPDLPRPGSRGPSVYHTPSSSLIHSSWATAKTSSNASTTPPGPSTVGALDSRDGESTETLPAPSNGRTEDELENGYSGAVPAILEHLDEDEENQASTALAKDVFGARDGIKHFYTSAKIGENVDEIFGYLAKRINARWNMQDEEDRLNGMLALDGEPGNVRAGGKNDSIRVGGKSGASSSGERKGWRRSCC